MLESGGQRPQESPNQQGLGRQRSPPKSWERRAPYQAVGAGWTAPPRQAEEEIHLGIPLRNLAGHNLAGEESKGDPRKIRQLPVERCPVPYFSEPQRPQRTRGSGDTEGIAGSVFSRLRQAPSARLAPKNQGLSLRALRLCVSNCNTWAQPSAISHQPAES